MVERDLAKVEVAGSSPVIRSNTVTRVSLSGNSENADKKNEDAARGWVLVFPMAP